MSQNKKVCNAFTPLEIKPEVALHNYPSVEDDDIIDVVIDDVVVKTGEGPKDYILKKEVREVSRINRRDYLNSQSGDLGILNIIKKVQMSGDVTLLNQRHRPTVNSTVAPDGSILEDIQDYTMVQKPIEKIQEDVAKGRVAYESLPEAFKQGTSFESFANLTVEELNNLLDKVNAEIMAKQKTKEEGK